MTESVQVSMRGTETAECRDNGRGTREGEGMRVGKSSDGTVVRTRALGKGRLFALRTTEQIRHADDDVDDSSRADCHANHGTERPLLTRGGRSRRSRDSRSHPESRKKTELSMSRFFVGAVT